MELRLQHGRQLLEQTAMPVTEVTIASLGHVGKLNSPVLASTGL
jgi:hypothetical protein